MHRGVRVRFTWLWFALGFVALVAGSGTTRGQEVVVAPLAWVDTEDPPDQLPVRTRELRPVFPPELLKTPDIGWASHEIIIDEKGRPQRGLIHATLPAYGRALAVAEDAAGKFKPGRRNGRAVNTRVRLTAAFNPAAAAPTAPDAPVRLLDAVPIIDPRRAPSSPADPEYQQVVWATVRIAAGGQPLAVVEAPAEVSELLTTAVRTWRFAPARRAGVPVEADVRVPFLLIPPAAEPPANAEKPKVLHAVPPVYPMAMRASGIRGEVTLEFVVDIEGRVRNPIVVRSLHPGFNAAAIEAVKRWTFAPGRVDGQPVSMLMQQPIAFRLTGEPEGGRDGMEVRRRGRPEQLPPQLRYDTGPKQLSMVLPRYPYPQLRDGRSGSAEVALLIDTHGRVTATRVVKASHPEFGCALQAAAQEFTYEPALRDGRPTAAMIGFQFEFRFSDPAQVPGFQSAALTLERRQLDRILKPAALDHPVRPRHSRAPGFPAGVANDVAAGEATVEMLIDEEGRVCLPRVKTATQPEFGYAAVHAVAEWRFEPPTSQGKPGVVRVAVPFSFRRPPAESAGGARPTASPP